MRGDGHTAYGGKSTDCIDPAVEAYLIDLVLPPPGKKCVQDVPFEAPQPEAVTRQPAPQAQSQIRQVRPQVRPLVH